MFIYLITENPWVERYSLDWVFAIKIVCAVNTMLQLNASGDS